MKKIINKAIVSLLIFSMLLSTCGCWNRRELDTLAIVMGVGIDKTDNPNEIEMTAQIAKSSEMKSNKGGGSQGKAFINITDRGTDPLSIFRKYTHKMSRMPYTSHNQTIILGEDLAKAGAFNSLNFFLQSRETRMTVNVLVAKGKASDIFEAEPEFSKLPAAEIVQLLDVQSASSETTKLTLMEFLSQFTGSGSMVAPIIEVKDEEEKKTVYISRGAVFKKDKLVGELDNKETRGLLWVLGKVKSGVIKVETKGESAFIEIKSAKREIKYKIQDDGKIVFNINITVTSTLSSQTGYEDFLKPEKVELLEKAEEEVIKKEIEGTINKARELDADIFGFSEQISKKNNKKWQDIKDKWEEQFEKLEVKVDVAATIVGSGRIAKAMTPEEE